MKSKVQIFARAINRFCIAISKHLYFPCELHDVFGDDTIVDTFREQIRVATLESMLEEQKRRDSDRGK